MSLSSIRQSALELPMQDRAALIDQLWDSIDSEIDRTSLARIEKQWAVESEERIDAVERGELKTLDGPKTIGELRRLVEK
jgi:putative addiction module component (TIGR02574 family)